MREYTDPTGQRWQVYVVQPTERRRRPAYLPEEMRGGWLCFHHSGTSRRLVPIPPDWETCPPDVLARYFDGAEAYTLRKQE